MTKPRTQLTTGSWLTSGDTAKFTYSTRNEEVNISMTALNIRLDYQVSEVVVERFTGTGELFYRSIEEFLQPKPANTVSVVTKSISSYIDNAFAQYKRQVPEAATTIFEGQRNQNTRETIPDISYSRFAALFIATANYGSTRPLEVVADLCNVSYEAAKMRIRNARTRKLLTTVGKGNKFQTSLTTKSITLLHAAREDWRIYQP